MSSSPSDWSLSIQYSGGGIGGVNFQGIAVDAAGNVWNSNSTTRTITELSPVGAILSSSTGYTGSAPFLPRALALDLAGDVWVANAQRQVPQQYNLQEFSANGTLLSGTNGFANACLSAPFALAIDAASNVWSNGPFTFSSSALCELDKNGNLISPTTGYTGGGLLSLTHQISIDGSGQIWPSGYNPTPTYNWALSRFSAAGAPLSPGTGYTSSAFNASNASAIDRTGNVWVCGFNVNTTTGLITGGAIAKFDANGNLLSPAAGYSSNFAQWILVDGANRIWSGYNAGTTAGAVFEHGNDGSTLSPAAGYAVPNGGVSAAVDGSGNLWQGGASAITETVGLAAPLVTPIVKAVSTNALGQRP